MAEQRTLDAERADFEAFAISQGWDTGRNKAGEYYSSSMDRSWSVWQAARRSPVADAAGERPVPWNARITEDERMHDDHAVIESMRAEIADLRAQLASELQAKEYEQRHAVESEAALAQAQAELTAARHVGKHLFDEVARQSAPEGAPVGMVLVEPTDEMVVAFAETWFSKVRPIDDCGMEDCYAAMLAAAPTSASAQPAEGGA